MKNSNSRLKAESGPDPQSALAPAGGYGLFFCIEYAEERQNPNHLESLSNKITRLHQLGASAHLRRDAQSVYDRANAGRIDVGKRFKIENKNEIEAEKEEQAAKENPQLALWKSVKDQLIAANGEQYFNEGKLAPADQVCCSFAAAVS